jgi:hypothetical protein
MFRLSCCSLVVLALAGCRAPAPSFTPFASSGATCIEPPRTGSYGMPDPYYQPGSGPSEKSNSSSQDTGLHDAAGLAAVDLDSRVPDGGSDDLSWTSPRVASSGGASGVVAAAYEEELDDDGTAAGSNVFRATGGVSDRTTRNNPFSIIPATSVDTSASRTASSGLRFRGMPVNDATSMREPATTTRGDQTILEISELPEPSPAVRARLRNSSSSARSSAATTSSADIAARSASSRSSSSSSDSGWTGR